MTTGTAIAGSAGLELLGPDNGILTVRFEGDWVERSDATTLPSDTVLEFVQNIANPHSGIAEISGINFDGASLTGWDSRVLVGIDAASRLAQQLGLKTDLRNLPKGIRALLQLSHAVPARGERRAPQGQTNVFAVVGQSFIQVCQTLNDANLFLGQSLLSFWRFMRGKARFLRADFFEFIQATGPEALPIVGIVNVLLGVILGFMGAVQLQQFGAQIYVADLVALGQTREIAPMMTAIVMAGRTGAAYAAQLGTMQVNEEIDALKTFGFSPMDFLVLPRMLALAVMFPVLVLYADALGIFGGYLVGVGILDLSTTEYIEQTRHAIDMSDIGLGLVKGSIFGVLVALTGCMHGIQSGRSASAVGDATTKAVVSGIIAIIATTAIFAVLTNVLGL